MTEVSVFTAGVTGVVTGVVEDCFGALGTGTGGAALDSGFCKRGGAGGGP